MAGDETVTAFCPGHISGYFRRVAGPDAGTTGSTGAGIVVSEGVTARVTPSERVSVEICREDAAGRLSVISGDSPPLRTALGRISSAVSVRTICRLPVGAGFGLSAAALLATLTAVDRLYSLGLGETRIAHIAHETEILHKTGLGDVAACRGGGMVVRGVAGIDAPVRRFTGYGGPVAAVSLGPIHTPSVLSSAVQMERVSAAYPPDVPGTIEKFFSLSRDFALRSGLATTEVREILDACEGGGIPAAMTMLGNGVFAYGRDAEKALSPFGEVCTMTIATQGPRIIAEGA